MIGNVVWIVLRAGSLRSCDTSVGVAAAPRIGSWRGRETIVYVGKLGSGDLFERIDRWCIFLRSRNVTLAGIVAGVLTGSVVAVALTYDYAVKTIWLCVCVYVFKGKR